MAFVVAAVGGSVSWNGDGVRHLVDNTNMHGFSFCTDLVHYFAIQVKKDIIQILNVCVFLANIL